MANKVRPHAHELVGIVGRERVIFDKAVRRLYARDVSNAPGAVDLMLKRTPECVVLPADEAQVAEILRWASATAIPITPRGGGTGRAGGCVPTKGGVVLDMRHVSEAPEIDVENLRVTAAAGAVIHDLEATLSAAGLELPCVSPFARAATVGGALCQSSAGLGSAQHGRTSAPFVSARIALPTGEVRAFQGDELNVVAGCLGATGVVTSATIQLSKKEEKVPVLVAYDKPDALVEGLESFRRLRIWHAAARNATFHMMRQEAGGAKTAPRKKYALFGVFTKSQYEEQEAAIGRAVEATGGKRLDDAAAAAEWSERGNALRAQRLGPSLAMADLAVPSEALGDFINGAETEFRHTELSIDATLMSDGYVAVLAFTLEDERRPEYQVGLSIGMTLVRLAKKMGGRCCWPGLLDASELPNIFGAVRADRVVAFKRAVDKSGIMNPGKVVGVLPRGAPRILPPLLNVDRQLKAKPAQIMMSKMAPMVSYLRPGKERLARSAQQATLAGIQAGALGQAHSQHVYSCSRCGACRWSSAVTTAVGHEGGSPMGIIQWAKAYVAGRFEPARHSAELIAAAAATQIDDSVCPSSIPLGAVFASFKAQIEADLGSKLTVSPDLQSRITAAAASRAAPQPTTPTEPTPTDGASAPQQGDSSSESSAADASGTPQDANEDSQEPAAVPKDADATRSEPKAGPPKAASSGTSEDRTD